MAFLGFADNDVRVSLAPGQGHEKVIGFAGQGDAASPGFAVGEVEVGVVNVVPFESLDSPRRHPVSKRTMKAVTTCSVSLPSARTALRVRLGGLLVVGQVAFLFLFAVLLDPARGVVPSVRRDQSSATLNILERRERVRLA